jgi:hypothetical protein
MTPEGSKLIKSRRQEKQTFHHKSHISDTTARATVWLIEKQGEDGQ